jgi:alpha-L-rhamnosidase
MTIHTKRLTRRNAAKLLLAGSMSVALPGIGTAKAGVTRSLRIDRARIEWQDNPTALDRNRPRFHWTFKATDRKTRGLRQRACRIRILSALDRRVIFDSGRIASRVQNFRPDADVPFIGQAPYIWQLQTWDQDGVPSTGLERSFASGLMTPQDRSGQWIAFTPDAENAHRAIEGRTNQKETSDQMPIFRKIFTASARPVFAHLAIVGVGQYQVWLNGNQVPVPGLNGAWTDYDQRVLYDGYDVTKLIAPGEQVLGVALGNGFFNVENIKGRYTKIDERFGQPQMWLQLKLRYADGRQETIVSDGSWQARIGGTTYSSIYGGEDFDARRDDGRFGAYADWRSAIPVAGPEGKFEASTFEPAIEVARLEARSVNSPKSGALVYDFGLNHAGRPRIHLKNMKAGAIVRMLPAELLLADGTVDQQSMTEGKDPGINGIWFTYTCRGGGMELWQPQFSYTGYRYLQVEGVDQTHLQAIESLMVRANLETAGDFSCSDKNMEAIHRLIRQALLSNTASVMTDCPTREKLGWLEQIYLNAATSMNNLDTARLYEKMTRDMRGEQAASGMVPSISPEYVKFLDKDGKNTKFRDTPEWGAAIVLAPWYVYQHYGDKGILAENYDAMKLYMAYLETRLGDDGLLDYGLGDWFDIGPEPSGFAQLTSRKMTGTATYFAQLVALEKIARLLGKPASESFAARAQTLKDTMRARLFNAANSTFDSGSQSAQAMALVLDLFPSEHREKALDILVADIRSRDNHVTAGDIGFHYVVRALSDSGRSDVLYDMLSRTDKPSYLQQVRNGATALTEAWDGWRQKSQNHFMLGHAEIWFFQGLGGVTVDFAADADAPIILAPQLVMGIDRCRIESETVVGHVLCAVSRRGSNCVVDVEVPAGQSARLRLPYTSEGSIRESGIPFEGAKGILATERTDGFTWVRLGSGIYSFSGQI